MNLHTTKTDNFQITYDPQNKAAASIEVLFFSADDCQDNTIQSVKDAMESLILAHFCAGVDVVSDAYQQGIVTACEAISNRI